MIFENLINIDNFANNKKNADQHRNELGLPFIYRLKQFLIFFDNFGFKIKFFGIDKLAGNLRNADISTLDNFSRYIVHLWSKMRYGQRIEELRVRGVCQKQRLSVFLHEWLLWTFPLLPYRVPPHFEPTLSSQKIKLSCSSIALQSREEKIHCGDSDKYDDDAGSGGERLPPGVNWWISGEPVYSVHCTLYSVHVLQLGTRGYMTLVQCILH